MVRSMGVPTPETSWTTDALAFREVVEHLEAVGDARVFRAASTVMTTSSKAVAHRCR